MDDFVVDDDSDGDYTSPKKAKKRRSRETFSGYSNVVILWGPHGVGKSACVEACAEELGYQVFEISPGGKRGGKELLEMIGEVGQSELVTKHRGVVAAAALEQVDGQVNVEGASTLKSEGRKALICLEEVDVLYEEDKGFWACVTGLVEKSRRPVVITCNGTSLYLNVVDEIPLLSRRISRIVRKSSLRRQIPKSYEITFTSSPYLKAISSILTSWDDCTWRANGIYDKPSPKSNSGVNSVSATLVRGQNGSTGVAVRRIGLYRTGRTSMVWNGDRKRLSARKRFSRFLSGRMNLMWTI
jgi:ATPase family associated with various cellular activities (AAA)